MSAPIGPGDWVECVEAWAEPAVILPGSLYLVAEIYDSQSSGCDQHGPECDGFGVELVGHEHPTRCYCSAGFRPIYRPKSEIIESLKQPAPERECEDA